MKVSEIFYSIQGEGKTTGRPSYFIRLSDCNLLCGGAGTQTDGKLHNGASWRCDSIEVWRKGKDLTNGEIWNQLINQNPYFESEDFSNIVITGGEPLLQMGAIKEFIQGLHDEFDGSGKRIHFEFETNGTIPAHVLLDHYSKNINEEYFTYQFNVSPKLSNSGMAKKVRYIPNSLDWFSRNGGAVGMDGISVIWKIVIANDSDFNEFLSDFIHEFWIDPESVWLMPAADNQKDLRDVSQKVVEICKKTGMNFSSRLQIEIWNKKTGV